MKLPFDPESFRWQGVDARPYKQGADFEGVTRYVFTDQPSADFALRYFEFEPGGYSSLEKHRHVHLVIVIRGKGKALVGQEVVELAPFDAVYVPSMTPHRWINDGSDTFGFLCPVDSDRDRPQPLDEGEREALRSNPETAPYAF